MINISEDENINEFEVGESLFAANPILLINGRQFKITGWNYYGGGYAESLEVYLDVEEIK